MRNAIWIGLVVLLCAQGAPAEAADDKYTMEDLTALAQQKGWLEFTQHANDIRPSQRKGEWSTMLGQAAEGLVADLSAKGDAFGAYQTAVDLLVRYPMLTEAKGFMRLRARTGKEGLTECFQKNRYNVQQCMDLTEKFLNGDPKNLELAFEMGKVARLNTSRGVAILFFERALKDKKFRKRCTDEQVKIAVAQAAGLDGDVGAALDNVAFQYCWKPLKETVMETFSSGNDYVKKAWCPELLKRKVLSKLHTKKCKILAKK